MKGNITPWLSRIDLLQLKMEVCDYDETITTAYIKGTSSREVHHNIRVFIFIFNFRFRLIYFHNIYIFTNIYIKTRKYKNNYGGVIERPIRPEMITP